MRKVTCAGCGRHRPKTKMRESKWTTSRRSADGAPVVTSGVTFRCGMETCHEEAMRQAKHVWRTMRGDVHLKRLVVGLSFGGERV